MPKINRKQFLEALKFVSAVTPDRSPMPILQYVKLDVCDRYGGVVGTDSEVRVGATIPCEGEIHCLVPAKKANDLLSACKDDEFDISLTGGGIKFVDSSGSYTFQTPPTDEFPEVTCTFEMDCKTDSIYLGRALPLISACCDEKFKGKFILDGVRFETSGSDVVLVATDQKRICSCVIASGKIDSFTLPMKSLRIVARMEGAISVGFRDGLATFLSDDKFVVSRTLQDHFPSFWYGLIESSREIPQWNVGINELTTALRKAAVFSAEESRGIDVIVGEKDTKFLAKGGDIGKGSIQIQGGSEKTGQVRFNGLDLYQFVTKIPDVARVVTRIGDRISMDVGDFCKFCMSTMEVE